MKVSLKTLVITGSILNLIMALFHIYLCYMIYNNYSAESFYPLLQMFAIGGMIMIFYLAFTSLLYSQEMTGTTLGAVTLILNILIYSTRALGEFILFAKPKPVIIAVCVVMTVLYLYIYLRAVKIRRGN
jgi:hypothetical protein